MRYDNWDIILFPEDSNIPIQEYKTACFLSRDEGNPTHLQRMGIVLKGDSLHGLTDTHWAQMARSYQRYERTLDH
jgi:hypothetical protein